MKACLLVFSTGAVIGLFPAFWMPYRDLSVTGSHMKFLYGQLTNRPAYFMMGKRIFGKRAVKRQGNPGERPLGK